MQLKTVQPSEFANRLYFNRRLQSGLKIKSKSTRKTYFIEGLDERKSEEGVFCYIIPEVEKIRDLFFEAEFEVVGYRPEYQIALKETKETDEKTVDLYLENLKENKKLERQYREYKKSEDFNLTGFWALDRKNFNTL